MSPLTIFLRFIFGVILAGSVAWMIGLAAVLTIAVVLSVGIAAAIWGDKFILGVMGWIRYLR